MTEYDIELGQLEEQNSQKWAWVDEFRNIEDECAYLINHIKVKLKKMGGYTAYVRPLAHIPIEG